MHERHYTLLITRFDNRPLHKDHNVNTNVKIERYFVKITNQLSFIWYVIGNMYVRDDLWCH